MFLLLNLDYCTYSDVALDAAGYHMNGPVQDSSDQLPVEDDDMTKQFPIASSSREPSPTRTNEATQASSYFPHSPKLTKHHTSQLPKPRSVSLLKMPQAMHRATSEPPPDLEELQQQDNRDVTVGMPVQQYSWEWGAFPQPSPMKSSFPKGRFESGKGKSKARMDSLESDDDMDLDAHLDKEPVESIQRSRSVPPELDGSPTIKRHELPTENTKPERDGEVVGSFGAGGRLTASRQNPTQFGVYIEGKTVTFELSIVDSDEAKGLSGNVFDGRDEVEAEKLFQKGKITYRTFLDDEAIVYDERLVIRWAGGQ